ncbi:hypothetical protein L3X38_022623 [Prunus dulcis]|uniref:CCHC-type domain-containing protein n=1 Tax=Prunus dulcis TaxID=3755 RepID=A0AAD4VY02_PRUDU|nr:hypothetical protein L3X38_022623 [Prunus dulcis]
MVVEMEVKVLVATEMLAKMEVADSAPISDHMLEIPTPRVAPILSPTRAYYIITHRNYQRHFRKTVSTDKRRLEKLESNNGGFHTSGYFTNRGSHFRGRGRGHNNYPSGPRTHQAPSNSSPDILGPGIDIPTCQICNKKGHVAADCYQRHNQPSAPTSSVQCQICWKYGHSAILCYHRDNFSYQGRPPSTNLIAMPNLLEVWAFCHSSSHEHFWAADIGATTYMTSNLFSYSFLRE